MVFSKRQKIIRISFGAALVKQVDAFKYQWIFLTQNKESFKAVRESVILGYEALGRLSKLSKSLLYFGAAKPQTLTPIVIPTATYGSECRVLKRERGNWKILTWIVYDEYWTSLGKIEYQMKRVKATAKWWKNIVKVMQTINAEPILKQICQMGLEERR